MATRKFVWIHQTEGYVEEQIATDEASLAKLTLTGVSGVALDGGNQRATNFGTPTASSDLTTKAYVDALASGVETKASVRAATTGALAACTYNNGTGGVGATLTANANGALGAIDGVTLVVSDRLLVKNQAAQLQNGVYTVTVVGDAGTAWKLTRAEDYDNSPSGEVTDGAFCFVEQGTTLADTGWVQITNNPITIGSSSLVYTQFSGAGTYLGGAGLTLTGSTFAVGAGQGITVNADDVQVTWSTVAGGSCSGAAGAAGTGTDQVARKDHSHTITAMTSGGASAYAVVASGATYGTSNTLARGDHTHNHGSLSGGNNHDAATTVTAGFMSATDKTSLDGLVTTNPPPSTRTLTAGAGLTGGGDLSANRQFDVELTASGGLEFSAVGIAGTLQIDVGNGLQTDADGLAVKADVSQGTLSTGLNISSSGVRTVASPCVMGKFTAGTGGVTQYWPLYIDNATGRVLRALPTSDAAARVIGVCALTAAANGDTWAVMSGGALSAGSGLTVGAPVWLQADGSIASALPAAGNRMVRIGFALSATTITVLLQDFGKRAA